MVVEVEIHSECFECNMLSFFVTILNFFLFFFFFKLCLEASKKILQYLAQCSGHRGDVDRVKDRLLKSNPVLEVHACTIHEIIIM